MVDDTTVFILDDDREVIDAVRWMVESVGYNVEAYTRAEDFLYNFEPERIGCLVLDIRMAEMSGLELQDLLLQKGIRIPVIFITGHGDIDIAVNVMKKGAFDFLTKPVNNQILLETINMAIKLDRKRHEVDRQKKAFEMLCSRLTPRETEIMHAMVQGQTTKQMGEYFAISPNTIEQHRSHIFKKMQVKNMIELANLVVKNQSLTSSSLSRRALSPQLTDNV